jgi:hypothetical protein
MSASPLRETAATCTTDCAATGTIAGVDGAVARLTGEDLIVSFAGTVTAACAAAGGVCWSEELISLVELVEESVEESVDESEDAA